jgi:hypothetical protein
MDSIRDDDLVLVAILPTPRDLEYARVLGWYRVPIESAPKSPHIDWLAFYLPASFGTLRWSIRYAARVLGVELVRRLDLLREASHPRAQEPYLKFQLGTVFELERPIPAGHWKRFTFIYTSGERLLQAKELKELRIPSSQSQLRL